MKVENYCIKRKIPVFFLIIFSVIGSSMFFNLSIRTYFIHERNHNIAYTDYRTTVNSEDLKTLSVIKDIKKDEGIWIVNSQGRLGNQMGEYATLLALAKLNKRRAYILPETFDYLAPLFRITLPTIKREVANRISWTNYWLHDWMAPEYADIKGKYVQFTGYPCSWTFFHNIRDEIRQEFRMHDHLNEEADRYLQKIKGDRKNATFIGVHVRRGDYVHVMPNTWKGVIGDKAYFEKAMAYFRNKYQEPVFVVASNGMSWCKENIDASKGDVYFSGDGNEASPGNDFAILVHCNHTILSVGTFGFWVAYLAGGEAIYLSNFTLPESEFRKVYKEEAANLPEWIGIKADLSPLLNHH
ncbi:galactoside alpha-(1,2)-fucosyltransferase 2-like [Protopterus annectens]|uniref:galactoside alpha-(1,2)-fucosyltransferase 2-like n=1 Tax=Protopterus annectens TaxID=7888 RepID=UPI001CFBE905|nr:galactoside alpha-(1,2)-fucosyltransferase 2-like [Protopterus annectens]